MNHMVWLSQDLDTVNKIFGYFGMALFKCFPPESQFVCLLEASFCFYSVEFKKLLVIGFNTENFPFYHSILLNIKIQVSVRPSIKPLCLVPFVVLLLLNPISATPSGRLASPYLGSSQIPFPGFESNP